MYIARYCNGSARTFPVRLLSQPKHHILAARTLASLGQDSRIQGVWAGLLDSSLEEQINPSKSDGFWRGLLSCLPLLLDRLDWDSFLDALAISNILHQIFRLSTSSQLSKLMGSHQVADRLIRFVSIQLNDSKHLHHDDLKLSKQDSLAE